MRDHYSWSVGIGRWLGVPVRLHISLFLFVALIFGLPWWQNPTAGMESTIQSTAIATAIILIISLLLHEMAHVFAATNLGGAIRHLILAPWGGDSEIELPITRRSQAIVYAAGPFANMMVCICGLLLLVQSGKGSVWEIINPLQPHTMTAEWEIATAKILTWVNFQMFWINLIPAHPFDGSYLVRIAITARNSTVEREKIETGVLIIGLAAAVIVFLAGWLLRDFNSGGFQPVWLIMVLAGLTMFFSARHGYYLHTKPNADDEWDDLVDDLDEEYSGYYEDNEDFFPYEDADSISQWLQEKQEAREQIEREIEAEEERRVDSILEKLHKTGIEGLNDDEKSLLQRVSDRYRKRNRQQSS